MESASFPESSTSDVLILFLLLAINLSVTVIDFLSFPQIIARYVFVIFLVLNKPLKCFKNSLFFDKTIHPDGNVHSYFCAHTNFGAEALSPFPCWTQKATDFTLGNASQYSQNKGVIRCARPLRSRISARQVGAYPN